MCRNKRQVMGETWSRGTNLRLPFDVNVMVNLSNLSIGGFHVTSSPPCWWKVNKRLLISSFCLSTSICSFHHCYLCLPRLHENNLFLKLYRGYLSPAQWTYSATRVRLTQCCTQFKSPGVKILCVLYLRYNVAFLFKWYGNSRNKTFYSQRVWIGYNIEFIAE